MNRIVERGPARSAQSRIRPARLGRFFWEVLWLPFWLGSTLPPPALPGRRERAIPPGERTPRILRQLDELRGIIWRQRAGILAFRTIWLAFLVLDAWLALRVVAGQRVSPWPFVALFLALFPLGVTAIALARPSRGQLARTLDRSFGLRERVSTALEEAHGRRLTGLRALQVVDATRVTGHVGKARAFERRLPVREILPALAAVLACAALLLAFLFHLVAPPRADGGAPEQTTPPGAAGAPGVGPMPGGAPAANGRGEQQGTAGAPTGASAQPAQSGQPGRDAPASGPSAQGQRDLDAVSGALRDHAATRDAADRLQAGDYRGAADALREAGRDAGQLSSDTRRGLAGDLRDAAGQVGDQQLRRDLNDTASALEGRDAGATQSGFDRVASDIERAGQGQPPDGQAGPPAPPQGGGQGQGGQQPPSGGAGAGGGTGAGQGLPGDQRQGPSYGQNTPPLGADGQPVELPRGDGRGPLIPSQAQGGSGGGPAEPGSATTGGGQLRQGAVGESGPDANRVPLDQRGAVERYFTPRSDEQEP